MFLVDSLIKVGNVLGSLQNAVKILHSASAHVFPFHETQNLTVLNSTLSSSGGSSEPPTSCLVEPILKSPFSFLNSYLPWKGLFTGSYPLLFFHVCVFWFYNCCVNSVGVRTMFYKSSGTLWSWEQSRYSGNYLY